MSKFLNNKITKIDIKSIQIPRILVLILIAFLTQTSFALTQQDISNKLDSLVLRENIFGRMSRVTNYGARLNTKELTIQTRFDLDHDEEVHIISAWLRDSWFDLAWGYGTLQNDQESSIIFDSNVGLLIKTYIYSNRLGQKIKMAFTISGEALKRVEESRPPLAVSAPTADTTAASAVAYVQPAVETSPAPEQVVVETLTSPAPSLVECEESSNRIKKFQGSLDKLEILSDFSQAILKASGEFDHLYSAAYFGTVGACNVLEGLMYWNPLAAAHGVGQMAVAAMSGRRAYETYKENAAQLLADIQDNAQQINDLSTSTSELVLTISKNLESVRTKLLIVQKEYDHVKALFERSSSDQSEALGQVLAKYEEARREAQKANDAFTELSQNSDEILRQWQEISSQLDFLESNLKANIKDAVEMKSYLLQMEERVTNMRERFSVLSEHFQKQSTLSAVVNAHRNAQDRLTSEATQMLLEIIRVGSEANATLKLAFQATLQKLCEADELIKCQVEELEKCRQQTKDVAALADAIKSDAVKAEKKVASMYTKKEIALATCAAVLCPGGTLLSVAAGFAALTAVHGRVGH